jgi:hypothetical protein
MLDQFVGLNRNDRFFCIPWGGGSAIPTEMWRRSLIALFIQKGLLNHDFARKLLGWEHSGFSIESGPSILDQPTREAL